MEGAGHLQRTRRAGCHVDDKRAALQLAHTVSRSVADNPRPVIFRASYIGGILHGTIAHPPDRVKHAPVFNPDQILLFRSRYLKCLSVSSAAPVSAVAAVAQACCAAVC